MILQAVVAATGWTEDLISDVDEGDAWKDHLGEIAAFAVIVGVVIPTAVGLALSWWLREAEQRGQLRPWHYALGARDHRDAWDYVFGREKGTYLLFTVAEAGESRQLLAKYGTESWASQAPARPQEIYVEEVWPADANGKVDEATLSRDPPRGMWINADHIERLEVLHLSTPDSSGGS